MLVWPHVPGPLCWCDGHHCPHLATLLPCSPRHLTMSHFLDWAGGRAATSSRPTPHMVPPYPAPHWSQPGPAAPCPGEGEPGGCRGVAAHSSGVLGTEELGLISAAGRCAHNWAAGLRAARCQPASSGTGSGQAEHCDTRHGYGRAHRTHDHHRECSKIG